MFLANGFLELHASTGDPEWIVKAITLAERALELFGDPGGGGLFDTDGTDATVLVRMKERHDGAEPSGNAIAASVFMRLAVLTGGEKWRAAAEEIWNGFQPWLERQPSVLPLMTATLQGATGKSSQLVIVGPHEGEGTRALLREYWSRFLPDTVLITAGEPRYLESLSRLTPFAAGLPMIDGKPTAYLCEEFACRLPVTSAEDLGRLLDALRTVTN
jgi:uncharacterized protein YyaL (SSP411 family)